MIVRLLYSKQAKKFLAKNENRITIERLEEGMKLAMRKLLQREDVPVDIIQLSGQWQGHWRIRIGGIRAIFRYEGGEPVLVNIEKIEHRGNVY